MLLGFNKMFNVWKRIVIEGMYMATVWVLINSEPGSEADVLKDLKKISEVLEAEDVVQHINFGKRTRYYKFNEASSKAIAVRNLIETF